MNEQLIHAAKEGNLDEVKRLHQNGADITADKNSALILASWKGHLHVVKYLIENGANISDQDNFALKWACEFRRLEVVKYLFEKGADITYNNVPLIGACFYNHLEIVKFLVEKGADVNLALNTAVDRKYIKLIEYLLSVGAIASDEETIQKIKELKINFEFYKVPLPDVKVAE